jgi:hypothetical protein
MPRPAAVQPIDEIIRHAADDVVARVSSAIARQVAHLVQERIAREMAAGRPARAARRGRGRAEINRWVADARARRVPNFVIEATGLDTKKKIVAKYGEGAAFERGKPAPRPRG